MLRLRMRSLSALSLQQDKERRKTVYLDPKEFSLTLAIVVDTVGIVFHTLPAAAWLILFVHLAFEAAFIYCVIGLKRATRRQDNG